MPDPFEVPRAVSRVTCMVHHLLERRVAQCLANLGARSVMVENARSVRQRRRASPWWLPGPAMALDDSPMDVFRVAVPRAATGRVMRELAEAAELRTPGHGMLYVQEVQEYGLREPPEINADAGEPSGLLRDLALITCILSMVGSGEQFARVALTLGAGVPVVSRGLGTGVRDRLGLLRITIPPEKEIVRLMVPAHDAAGIRRLLIEEGGLDRPGGGFLYQTPIREGLIDPLLHIGRQGDVASMEQVIAALDDIKAGTAWRQRFAGIQYRTQDVALLTMGDYVELVFNCAEGAADDLVRVAVAAGADGATTARVRCLCADPGGAGVAREIGVLCIPQARADKVRQALCRALAAGDDADARLQTLEAPAIFTHQRRRS